MAQFAVVISLTYLVDELTGWSVWNMVLVWLNFWLLSELVVRLVFPRR